MVIQYNGIHKKRVLLIYRLGILREAHVAYLHARIFKRPPTPKKKRSAQAPRGFLFPAATSSPRAKIHCDIHYFISNTQYLSAPYSPLLRLCQYGFRSLGYFTTYSPLCAFLPFSIPCSTPISQPVVNVWAIFEP